jgi:tetratricopeptide (TPR) repeat protein
METISDINIFYNKSLFFYNQGKYFDSLNIIDEGIAYFNKYEINEFNKVYINQILQLWNLRGELLDSIGNELNTTTSMELYDEILNHFCNKALSDLDDIITKLKQYELKYAKENGINIIACLAFAHKQKGRILGYLRKYDDAIKNFNVTLSYMEKIKNKSLYKYEFADTHRQLGYIYAMQSDLDYETSIICLENIKEFASLAITYNTLGYIYMLSVINNSDSKNNSTYIEKAIENFDKAVHLDSTFSLPWRNKGYSLFLKSIEEINIENKNECYSIAERCIDQAIKLDQNNPYPWQYKGYIEFELNKYNNAITYFSNAIRIKPDFSLAWYNKGITFDCIGEYEKAIESFNEAIKHFRKNIHYLKIKHQNKIDINTNYFDEERKLASVLNSKGASLSSLGKKDSYSEAIKCFTESIEIYESLTSAEINTEKSLVYFNRGYTYGNLTDYEKAVKDFEKSLENLPKDEEDLKIARVDICRNLGFAYGRLKINPNHIKARVNFENAVKDFPNDEEIKNLENQKRLALAYNSKGYHTIYFLDQLKNTIEGFNEKKELEEALICFEKALSIFENRDKNDQNMAYIFYNKGYTIYKIDNKKINKALECFEISTKKKPNFADGWYSRGVFKYKLGEELKKIRDIHDLEVTQCFNDAIECFNNAIEIFQKEFQQKDDHINYNLLNSWYDKGIVFYNLGQYEEALHCFGQAIGINKSFVYAYIDSGLILNKFERYEEAIRYFNQSLKLLENGESDDIRNLVLGFKGISHYLFKQYDEAIKCFDCIDKQLTNEFPMLKKYRPQFDIVSGLCHFNLENYSEAKKEFEKIINDDNSKGENNLKKSIAHIFIGLCLYNLGPSHDDKAIEEFTKSKDYNSGLAHAYYNLAVVHNKKNDYNKVKEELKSCLKNGNKKYREVLESAKEGLQKIENINPLDWYKWWFGQSKIKKTLGILLILTLIAFIVSPLIFLEMNLFSPYGDQSSDNQTSQLSNQTSDHLSNQIFNEILSTQTMSWLALSIGIIVGMLFLPVLQRFKIGGAIELETTKFNTDNISNEISPLLSSIDPIDIDSLLMEINAYSSSYSLHMPIVYNLQSFRVPLRLNARMKLLNPIEPSSMPIRYPNILLLNNNS